MRVFPGIEPAANLRGPQHILPIALFLGFVMHVGPCISSEPPPGTSIRREAYPIAPLRGGRTPGRSPSNIPEVAEGKRTSKRGRKSDEKKNKGSEVQTPKIKEGSDRRRKVSKKDPATSSKKRKSETRSSESDTPLNSKKKRVTKEGKPSRQIVKKSARSSDAGKRKKKGSGKDNGNSVRRLPRSVVDIRSAGLACAGDVDESSEGADTSSLSIKDLAGESTRKETWRDGVLPPTRSMTTRFKTALQHSCVLTAARQAAKGTRLGSMEVNIAGLDAARALLDTGRYMTDGDSDSDKGSRHRRSGAIARRHVDGSDETGGSADSPGTQSRSGKCKDGDGKEWDDDADSFFPDFDDDDKSGHEDITTKMEREEADAQEPGTDEKDPAPAAKEKRRELRNTPREISESTVHFAGVPYSANATYILRVIAEQFDGAESVRFPNARGRNCGWGFVDFVSPAAARAAVSDALTAPLRMNGREVTLKLATKPRPDSPLLLKDAPKHAMVKISGEASQLTVIPGGNRKQRRRNAPETAEGRRHFAAQQAKKWARAGAKGKGGDDGGRPELRRERRKRERLAEAAKLEAREAQKLRRTETKAERRALKKKKKL
jgi:hypothetical protein